MPADPILRDHAATIEQEVRRSRRGRAEADELLDDGELERAQRRETEPDAMPEFVPLNADVVPQMSLFGPPQPVRGSAAERWGVAPGGPTTAAGTPGATDTATGEPAGAAGAGPREIPAFERRRMLRDERHRLVSEVRRRDGTSHREINAWLNRKLGIASVEKASLSELERSVELLVGKLTGRR